MNKNTYIFDMDGVLIDSEPQWQMVEKRVFADIGIDLTDEMVASTTGLRCQDVVAQWHRRFAFTQKSQKQVQQEIINGMVDCFETNPSYKPGAKALIERLAANPDNTVAICSGSPIVLIETLVRNLGLEDKIALMHSAEDDEFGKPHPLPYLNCAKDLGKDPSDCVVFEDSAVGAISAKAAGMYVIAIPEGQYSQDKFAFCDEVIGSLLDY